MKILLLSRWSSGVVYDLYFFLKSLKGIEVIPCSYRYRFNERMRLKELEGVSYYHLGADLDRHAINSLCESLGVDLICISWLVEIKEIFDILKDVNRKTIIFPHGSDSILREMIKLKKIFLVYKDQAFRRCPNYFELNYFVSRRFANNKKETVDDRSIFYSGYSNLRMKKSEKKRLLEFVQDYSQRYRLCLTRLLLYTLYPFRFLRMRRILYRLLSPNAKDFGSHMLDVFNENRNRYDAYFKHIMHNQRILVKEYIPYDLISDEIAKANFVDVTPAYHSDHIPARATIALASGTVLLLKRGYCPLLEAIINDYRNGFVYDDYKDIFRLNENKELINDFAANALAHRHKFTLENYSDSFLEFLNRI